MYLNDIFGTGKNRVRAFDKTGGNTESSGISRPLVEMKFMVPSAVYLGHKVDSKELHPSLEKVKHPGLVMCMQELKPFLGLLTYYGKSLMSLSTISRPQTHPQEKVM